MIPSNRRPKKPSRSPSIPGDVHDIFHPDYTHLDDSVKEDSDHSSFMLDEEDDDPNHNKSETIEKVLSRLGLDKKIEAKENSQELEMLVGNIVENCIGTIDSESNTEEYERMFGEKYNEAAKLKAKNTSIIINELTDVEKIELLSDTGLTAIVKEIRLFLK